MRTAYANGDLAQAAGLAEKWAPYMHPRLAAVDSTVKAAVTVEITGSSKPRGASINVRARARVHGAGEERGWDSKAERLGVLEVDGQLELVVRSTGISSGWSYAERAE